MRMETKLDDHIKSEERYQETMTRQMEDLHNKIDGLDSRFSAKWVEKGLISIAIFIIGSITWAIIQLV